MSLRRFPWKAPRLTDNSFKLFVSPPSPNTPLTEAGPRQGSDDKSRSTAEVGSGGEDSHHHHHRQKPEGQTEGPPSTAESTASQPAPRIDAPKPETIKGPWRLLRLLPRESRAIIGSMLEVNPKRRATLEDMMSDTWVTTSPVCCQIEGGKVVRAPGHEHTLEPGTAAQPAES